jgi:hypothetical protein
VQIGIFPINILFELFMPSILINISDVSYYINSFNGKLIFKSKFIVMYFEPSTKLIKLFVGVNYNILLILHKPYKIILSLILIFSCL